MDTRFVESFIAVADMGSMAEAARRLNLTAAAVAQQIKALEQDIGSVLLVRAGRTVRPSAAGLAVLPQCRELVRRARDLPALAAGDTPRGELRLGSIATALTGLLPAVLADLTQRHPGIELRMRPGSSVELYHLVLAGELDAAVLLEPQFSLPKSCAWRTLREEPLVLIAPAQLPVVDVHSTLCSQPFIRYDRKHWGGQMVERYLKAQGLAVRERLEIDALDAIAAFVDQGMGVALVPDWASPWPAGLRLQKVALPASTELRKIGVLWGQGGPRIAAARAFVAACQQHLQGP